MKLTIAHVFSHFNNTNQPALFNQKNNEGGLKLSHTNKKHSLMTDVLTVI